MSLEIYHRIWITAPIDLVWQTTVDVAAWPDWSPTITAARLKEGMPIGEGMSFILKQPWQVEKTWHVIRFEAPTLGAWQTRGNGPAMTATHSLAPTGSGCISLLTLEVEQQVATRLLQPVFWFALRAENRALKRRCEGDMETPPACDKDVN